MPDGTRVAAPRTARKRKTQFRASSIAHPLRVRVQPEVDRAGAMPLAREHDPRVLVGQRHRDVRERFVSSRSRMLNTSRCRLTRLCSRCSASASFRVTITSTSEMSGTSCAVPTRPSPRWKWLRDGASGATSPSQHPSHSCLRPDQVQRPGAPGAAFPTLRRSLAISRYHVAPCERATGGPSSPAVSAAVAATSSPSSLRPPAPGWWFRGGGRRPGVHTRRSAGEDDALPSWRLPGAAPVTSFSISTIRHPRGEVRLLEASPAPRR